MRKNAKHRLNALGSLRENRATRSESQSKANEERGGENSEHEKRAKNTMK